MGSAAGLFDLGDEAVRSRCATNIADGYTRASTPSSSAMADPNAPVTSAVQ